MKKTHFYAVKRNYSIDYERFFPNDEISQFEKGSLLLRAGLLVLDD